MIVKKLAALCWLSLLLFRAPGFLRADSASSVDVVMAIQSLAITWDPNSADHGNIPITVLENQLIRSVVTNTGNGAQDYSLSIASTTGSWTPVTFVPSIDEYALFAIWHEWNTIFTSDTVGAAAEFQSNDAVTGSEQLSSDTIFFNDIEFHSTTGVKGYHVLPNEDRSLFILVFGPVASTGGPTSTAHVRITVSASP